MSRRDAVLTGISRAAELHHELKLRDRLRDGNRPIDVFATIQAMKVMVLFRPLDGLLGAYVPTPNAAGMLVSTRRDHHVQRFTASHELGHHMLEHRAPSLDLNIGFVGRGEKAGYDEQEIEADAFAAEFLLPKWLIAAHQNSRSAALFKVGAESGKLSFTGTKVEVPGSICVRFLAID